MDDSAPGSENEGEDDEENIEDLPLEEQLAFEKKRVSECQEMVSNLVEQFTSYKRIVEDEKEDDKKKIAGLVAQLEEQKKKNAVLQEKLESSSTVAADQALREKVKALTADLNEQRQLNATMRVQMVANLKGLDSEVKSMDETNKKLQAMLAEERATQKQTLQQLWALQKQVRAPLPAVHDQEIRLRVSFDGPQIKTAVMVPETDKERQRLLEENDIVKSKFLTLSQKHCMLRDELDQAKTALTKSSDAEKKLTSELSDLRASYTSALNELSKLKSEGGSGSGGGASMPSLPTTPALPGEAGGDDDGGKAKDSKSSLRALQKEAFRIYGKFCIPGVDKDIQLGAEMRQELFKVISNTDLISPQVFAPARSAVIATLENDGLFGKWLAEAAPSKSQESGSPAQQDAPAAAAPAGGEASEGAAQPADASTPMTFEYAFGHQELRAGLQEFMEKNGAGNAMLFLAEVEEFSQIQLDKLASEKRHRRRKVSHSRTTLSFDETQIDDLGGSTSPRRRRHSNRSVTKAQLTTTAESPLAIPQSLSPLSASTAVAASRLRGVGRSAADDLARSLAVSPNPVSDDGRVLALPTVPGSAHARLRSASGSVVNKANPVRPLGAANGAILLGKVTGAAADVLGDGKKTLHKHSRLQMYPSETDLQEMTRNGILSPSSELLSPTRTQYIQNLDDLMGGDLNPKRMINSAVSMGAVNYILPVHDRVWVANGSGAPIQVFDRNKAQQLFEVMCKESVVRMMLIGTNVWVATQGKDILYTNQLDRSVSRTLVGHEKGPVQDLVRVGKSVWSVAADSCICSWDPVNMKLRKKVKTPWVISCILHVNGVVWIGTILGLVFYDPETMNKLKVKGGDPAPAPTEDGAAPLSPAADTPDDTKEKMSKILKAPVSTLLRVREEVWAVHYELGLISVWDANTRTVITIFSAGTVEKMVLVGEEVWLCGRDNHVRCVDIHTRTITCELSGTHDDRITSIAVSKSEGLLRVWTGSSDHSICIWSTGLRCHAYKESGSRTALCAVCHKSLRSFGTKTIVCNTCGIAVHAKCFDQVPYGSACPGRPASI